MSVWTEIGMRDGKFYGVIPELFLRETAGFFIKFIGTCLKETDPDFTGFSWQKYMDFFATFKTRGVRKWDIDSYNNYWDYFSFYRRGGGEWGGDSGFPIPESLWCAPPTWERISFSEKEILGEEIIKHPLVAPTAYPLIDIEDLEWHKQRYRLIQKGRFCIIPVTVELRIYDEGKIKWVRHGWYHNGYMPEWNLYGYRFTFSDYWAQDGVDCRVGIFIDPDYGATGIPFSGGRWFSGKQITIDSGEEWEGGGTLRAYGVIDLSTHPDFARYYDYASIVCPLDSGSSSSGG